MCSDDEIPVGEVAHEDSGDGEDDDEGGTCEDLVLPALATVGPGAGGELQTVRLVQAWALAGAGALPAVAPLVPELDTPGHGLAGHHDQEVRHLTDSEAQREEAQGPHPGQAREDDLLSREQGWKISSWE